MNVRSNRGESFFDGGDDEGARLGTPRLSARIGGKRNHGLPDYQELRAVLRRV